MIEVGALTRNGRTFCTSLRGRFLRFVRFSGRWVTVCATVYSTNVLAQEYVEHQTNVALSAFYGFCLNDMFDLKGVSEMASRMGWEKISASGLLPFIPQIEAEILEYDGYILTSPDDPPVPMAAFVGVSKDPDGLTEHCSLFFKDVLPDEFVPAFFEDTNAELVFENSKIAGSANFYTVPEFPNDFVLLETQTRGRGVRASRLIPRYAN